METIWSPKEKFVTHFVRLTMTDLLKLQICALFERIYLIVILFLMAFVFVIKYPYTIRCWNRVMYNLNEPIWIWNPKSTILNMIWGYFIFNAKTLHELVFIDMCCLKFFLIWFLKSFRAIQIFALNLSKIKIFYFFHTFVIRKFSLTLVIRTTWDNIVLIFVRS